MGCQDDLTDPVHRRVTGRRLVRDLRRLGVQPGQTLLVHASVRSIGLAIGGASVVIGALRKAVGRTGNVVAPTGTPGKLDDLTGAPGAHRGDDGG